MGLKEKIEKVLSEILSDKHDCIVTLRFEPAPADIGETEKEKTKIHRRKK